MQVDNLTYDLVGKSAAEPNLAAEVISSDSVNSDADTVDVIESSDADTVDVIESDVLSCVTLIDGRRRIEYFGQRFPREQMLSWFKTAVDFRFAVDAATSIEETETVPAMVLKKAYISAVGTSMTAVVVIVNRQGEGETIHRGSKTRLNWNGTDREFSRILSEALDDALSTVSFDGSVEDNCQVES